MPQILARLSLPKSFGRQRTATEQLQTKEQCSTGKVSAKIISNGRARNESQICSRYLAWRTYHPIQSQRTNRLRCNLRKDVAKTTPPRLLPEKTSQPRTPCSPV